MNFEKRLEFVERQNRQMKFCIIILLSFGTLSFILGLTTNQDIPDVIRARAFQVVSKDGKVLVAIEDTLGLNTGKVGSIVIQNQKGKSIVEIWQTSNGQGAVSTLNENGQYLVKVEATKDGSGAINIFDSNGRNLTQLESQLQKLKSGNLTNSKTSVGYKIISIDDISVGQTRRYNVRVRVGHTLNYSEIKQISEKIIEDFKSKEPHNALSLLFYLPDSDLNGHYTAGMAEWAPFGDWARADEVQTGDYSKHRLSITTGNATGIAPSTPKVTGLSLSLKKRIFYDLVKAQDDGVGDIKAYEIIAKKYKISIEKAKKIAVEGVVNGWPMP